MPTLLRAAGYRIYFYSHEPNEPAHVHVDKGENSAKYWLFTLQLALNLGYSAKELGEIKKLLQTHQSQFLEAWHGYFGTKSG